MRSPSAEASTTFASSESRTGAESPMGEAVTRLPPIVARLRIWREPKTQQHLAQLGKFVAERFVDPGEGGSARRSSTR